MSLSPHMVKLLHVARSKTGMDEETYRAMLSAYGAKSSKDACLQPKHYHEMLQKMGFTPVSKKSQRPPNMDDESRGPLLHKIEAIILDMGLSWAYADGMAVRMFKVQKVAWCNARQLHKLAAALVYHQKRHAEAGNG
jgi:phage gp16-like protein